MEKQKKKELEDYEFFEILSKTILKNQSYNIFNNKSLFKNLKYQFIHYIFNYFLKINFICNILFLIILHIYPIIF